jgi:23S rRNA pseudouridine1911/1915/1917 synthase
VTEVITLQVSSVGEGQRLDAFITGSVPDVTRSQVQRWISLGCVLVDGKLRKPGYTLSTGQTLQVSPPPPEPSHLVPEDLPLEIVYEDADLLVVNKPAGMVVHPGTGNRRGTLANALAYHMEQLSRKDPMRPGIVHRLDKGTSGLLLVAKNEVTHDRLTRLFQRRKVHKVYLALLHGELVPEKGEIAVPIGRDSRSRTRISTRTSRPRTATTRYEVIRYLRGFTFVRAFPVTGRTHQIRVHFHHLGHPVVGDPTYIRKEYTRSDSLRPKLNRLFLHATRIELQHPSSGEALVFEAPLPHELAHLIKTLGE